MAKAAYQDQHSFQAKLKTHSHTVFILGFSIAAIMLSLGLTEIMDYVSNVTNDGYKTSSACAGSTDYIACFNSGNTVYIINEQGVELRKTLYNGSI